MTVVERSAGTSTGRPRVLLVEDDPAAVRLLEAGLRELGMVQLHGDVAATLAEAIAMLDGRSFDAVLLDLSLPDSQGLATVTTLLEAHPDVPVVVLTGTDDDRLAAAAIEAGAQDYLVKGSVAPEVLVRVIHHARERHGLLAAVEQRELRIRAMAESVTDGIYRLRVTPTAEFEYLNSAVARLSGIPLEQLRTDPPMYLERVHHEDRWKLDLDELEPGHTRTIMVRFQRPDGEWIVLETERTPIVENGLVVGVQGVLRDVTARERTTRALHDALWAEQRAAEQLRATSAMKGQFLQAVSHELRTPLTSIIGFAETLVGSIDRLAPEQVRVFHERILDNARRLRLLTTDLLDLEQVGHDQLQPCRVETDVTALAEQLARELSTGTRRLVVDDTPCVAAVDPGMTERIIRKLLVNAVKHTPPTTSVTVRCSRDQDVARITVVDDGPGIPDQHRERAFEPFWQGPAMQDAPSPGTGVGLAIVRQFADLHGGRAWLEATPGGGVTVHVELGVRAPAEAPDGGADAGGAVVGGADTAGDAAWRYLPMEHRRSLQQAMAELLDVTDAMEATDAIAAHLLRSGAVVIDERDATHERITVAVDPDVAAVRLTHPDGAVRQTLDGQVEVLTSYAHHALATSEMGLAPRSVAGVDGAAVVFWATRELLAASTVDQIVGIVLRAVHALGGAVLPARLGDEDSLPHDLTLGSGEPLLPVAPAGSAARALLQRHLPGLVADARNTVDNLQGPLAPGSDAATRLATREELHHVLARLDDDDVLAAVDLHGLDELRLDDAGVEAIIRSFASCLREQVRTGDRAARVGVDEFALLLRGTDREGAVRALERLRGRWEQLRPYPVVFSAGLAVAGEHDRLVVRNVEQALYLARSTGSGGTEYEAVTS